MKQPEDNCLVWGMSCDTCGVRSKQAKFLTTGYPGNIKVRVYCPEHYPKGDLKK